MSGVKQHEAMLRGIRDNALFHAMKLSETPGTNILPNGPHVARWLEVFIVAENLIGSIREQPEEQA